MPRGKVVPKDYVQRLGPFWVERCMFDRKGATGFSGGLPLPKRCTYTAKYRLPSGALCCGVHLPLQDRKVT